MGTLTVGAFAVGTLAVGAFAVGAFAVDAVDDEMFAGAVGTTLLAMGARGADPLGGGGREGAGGRPGGAGRAGGANDAVGGKARPQVGQSFAAPADALADAFAADIGVIGGGWFAGKTWPH